MRGEVAVKATPGVVDSLSEGFGIIHRRLWVVLLPIGLDAFLWLMPRVTARPLVEQFVAAYSAALSDLGGAPTTVGTADLETVQRLGESFASTNLLSLLAWNPIGAVVPSFVAGMPLSGTASLVVTSLDGLLALVVGFQLAGLLLGCVFLGLLGQLVREGRPRPLLLVGRISHYWLTFLAFVGLLLGIALGLSLVLAVLSLVPTALTSILSAMLTTTAVFVGLFLGIYLFFFAAAVVVGEHGVFDGIRSSFRTVRESFWSSIGLILLTILIGQGMYVIWSRLAEAGWGIPIAILGNAYVASGLTAAGMCFYRSRALQAVGPTSSAGRDSSRR